MSVWLSSLLGAVGVGVGVQGAVRQGQPLDLLCHHCPAHCGTPHLRGANGGSMVKPDAPAWCLTRALTC